eukprot:341815-Hanusia_phi.AAC.2
MIPCPRSPVPSDPGDSTVPRPAAAARTGPAAAPHGDCPASAAGRSLSHGSPPRAQGPSLRGSAAAGGGPKSVGPSVATRSSESGRHRHSARLSAGSADCVPRCLCAFVLRREIAIS